MDKEKIVTALETCIGCQPCKDCPYEKGYLAFPSCAVDMFKDALTVIKELENKKCSECKFCVRGEDGKFYSDDIVCSYWMSDGLTKNDFCSRFEKGIYKYDPLRINF